MNFHRIPFVILSVVVLVIAGSLTYFYTIWREPPGPEYGWGGNSTLRINLTLARPNISINETLHYTITLKNTGLESVRVYIDGYTLHLKMYEMYFSPDWNSSIPGSPVENFTTIVSAHPMSDPARFNKRLKVLGPGEQLTVIGLIGHGVPGGGGWDLRPNMTYYVLGSYYFYERPPAYPALPCWRGDVDGGGIRFSVLP